MTEVPNASGEPRAVLYRASDAGDMVSGRSILAFVGAMGSFRARAIRMLATHGIPEPTPDEWYPWQRYLDTVREIAETVGPATVSRIGRLLVEQDEFVDDATLESVLKALDPAYKARHRARDAGDFHYEPAGPRSARVLVRNP